MPILPSLAVTSGRLVDHFDRYNHVLVVRAWLERREIVGRVPEWRGEVEHLPNGTRRPFSGLAELFSAITAFLQDADAIEEER
jgi:hypothetical protein